MIQKIPIHRRIFIRRVSQGIILVASGIAIPIRIQIVGAAPQQTYGAGTYGQGRYPGYQTNLPLVIKEGH